MVPNSSHPHGSSSPMAPRRPPHFFKIILPSAMAEKKLRIPAKFVREFGDKLSARATLTVPNGQIWQVGLEEAQSKIWFQEGWRDFVEHHSIDHGYFLVFRYEGNSNFSVLVFDQTSTEIQYPWNNKKCQRGREDQVDLIKLDDSENSGHDELIKKEMSNSDELSAEPEDREILVGKRRAGTSSKAREAMSRGSKRAIEAAKMLKPKSPSFMAIMRFHQIHSCFMYVPVGFAINYIRTHQIVKLQTCDGQWHATCCSHKRSSSAMQLRRGWNIFCKENNLEEGDVCVFELIKRKPIVLKVSIFRMVDYA
ncbi:B3 domain-containing transcription factor VRN1 [Morella rubra]|uniref:B3 domain-containing transcription factor VRN1 n=1 Tax=Morella rubra TaxID=262757 RepID=A0A6A1UZG9_9ROSI|nr:B3 domain-containing transcription factor VRN1 [Morella rubra]KAB1205486.1 B3 domain-containing transcription factor VRN1 [Morella rubra]KAB1207420.1 B3 domain-containing transcription factor VRN1 [Morella rubra]